MKTLIIVPAYNEEQNIPSLVEILKQFSYDYIIINDCSTDKTEQLLDEERLNHLDLPNNIGLAGVTQIGFRYAVENGYDGVVVIDGDGQHPPKYIESLLDKLYEGYDYVIGSRYVTNKKPWSLRMIGSRLICAAIAFKTRHKVTDPTSGMRAIGKRVLEDFVQNMNYVAEPDALCHVILKGCKVCEVQVKMHERSSGTSYFVNPFRSILFMYNVMISILLFQW